MKELSIQEKALRYDKAIKEASIAYKDEDKHLKATLERIFPELKESEDEKLREQVVYAINQLHVCECTKTKLLAWLEKQGQKETTYDEDMLGAIEYCKKNNRPLEKEHITWLEKQGEQNPYSGVSFEYNGHTWGMCARDGGVEIAIDSELKAFVSLDKSFVYPNRPQKILVPQSVYEAVKEEKADNANKVEPKFKVGNWYQCTKDFFGKGVTFDKNTAYYCAKEGCLQDEYGCHIAIVKDLYDNFKLWDISDANDGDMLVAKGEYFKEYIFIYSKMTDDNVISTHCGYDVIRNNFDTRLTRFGRMEDFETVHPVTKEQRDQLEKAMADAGFTFDFEKKELKKIEQKPVVIPKFKVGDKVKKGYLTYTVEDINEDSYKLQAYSKDGDKGCTVFLTIGYEKDYELVEQNPTWSEEDENMRLDLIQYFADGYGLEHNLAYIVDWLKSLKPQKQWKPSEEQMEALVRCVDYLEESDNEDLLVMESLLEQLKSLK